MTPAEALARLGLDPAASPDRAALRRAYLQAVKRHKPEVDPQGFQEVRGAYELLGRLGETFGPQAPFVVLPTPAAAPPQEPEARVRVDALEAIRAALAGHETERALAQIDALVETATATLPRSAIIRALVRGILWLEWQGRPVDARGIRIRLARYIGGEGLPLDAGPQRLHLLHLVSRELGSPHNLPPALVRALAGCALENDFAPVPTALAAARREDGYFVDQAIAGLSYVAPTLQAILRPPRHRRRRSRRRRLGPAGRGLLFWLLFLIGAPVLFSACVTTMAWLFGLKI
jgi:hypothetical protein